MSFQINHNLLHDIDNKITLEQWEELMAAVRTSLAMTNGSKGLIYAGVDKIDHLEVNESRYFCYDNRDLIDVPGLDFVLRSGDDKGTLTVYNGSEQARAPITLEQGLKIAHNFFNYEGYDMSEQIVCDWVMDGNPSIF